MTLTTPPDPPPAGPHRPGEAQVVANSLTVTADMLRQAEQASEDGDIGQEIGLLGQAIIILRIAAWRLRNESWSRHPEIVDWCDDLASQIDQTIDHTQSAPGRLSASGDVEEARQALDLIAGELAVMAGNRTGPEQMLRAPQGATR